MSASSKRSRAGGLPTEIRIARLVLLLRMQVFLRSQGNLYLQLNWGETNTCPTMIATWQGNWSFIQYKKYELVKEDVSGGDSCKSATSSLYNLFYITLGVLMAAFAPVYIPAGLASICLVSISWVNSANHSHDDKCSVHSIHRLIPFRLEVAAVVISSWWFHLGDFALVISRSINFIDYPLKNSHCSSKVFIFTWQFPFHATCILYLNFQLQKV